MEGRSKLNSINAVQNGSVHGGHCTRINMMFLWEALIQHEGEYQTQCTRGAYTGAVPQTVS